MAAYIDHAAFAVRDLDWHRRFFHKVLGMEEEKKPCQSRRTGPGVVLWRGPAL